MVDQDAWIASELVSGEEVEDEENRVGESQEVQAVEEVEIAVFRSLRRDHEDVVKDIEAR